MITLQDKILAEDAAIDVDEMRRENVANLAATLNRVKVKYAHEWPGERPNHPEWVCSCHSLVDAGVTMSAAEGTHVR